MPSEFEQQNDKPVVEHSWIKSEDFTFCDLLSKSPSPSLADIIIYTSKNFSPNNQEKHIICSRSGSMLIQQSNYSLMESNLNEAVSPCASGTMYIGVPLKNQIIAFS
ncbi:hypothetical protein PPACK8108_LOCUS21243 [Phakopsora pachyrhizi]|uniref:Uncharacterized protein n=1 Tax=Phakopsora pachyrhizi TaxID=170000 RepID=A0AAV0BLY0_PHAPC|nr:hypothetical protein PPACK8108_LOCUS21243 [Phakopsora pachyrhizi]